MIVVADTLNFDVFLEFNMAMGSIVQTERFPTEIKTARLAAMHDGEKGYKNLASIVHIILSDMGPAAK